MLACRVQAFTVIVVVPSLDDASLSFMRYTRFSSWKYIQSALIGFVTAHSGLPNIGSRQATFHIVSRIQAQFFTFNSGPGLGYFLIFFRVRACLQALVHQLVALGQRALDELGLTWLDTLHIGIACPGQIDR